MMEVVPEPTIDVPKIEDNYDELLKQLRRDWKWAASSDFLYKFNPMLHLDFLDLADVEHDLIRGTSETIMTVFIKILHVLTSIRGLAPDTWETYLRRLYARRVPENRVWGTEEEPIAWAELGLINRLGILHDLCEWQFQNPTRVRQSMKDDSDDASWRSAPIGKDSKRNEYWHLGRDRLWIKRPTTKPEAPTKDLKRKKHPTKGAQQPSKRKAPTKATTKATPSQSKAKPRKVPEKPSKVKDKKPNGTNGTNLGSRVSRRGGGDGWQKVPEDWLKDTSTLDNHGKKKKDPDAKDMEALFDADSDLTDLSDNDKPEDAKTKGVTGATPDSGSDLTDIEDEQSEDEDEKRGSTEQSEDVKMFIDPRDDPNFVEFETICVTMNEWSEFAEQFKSVKSHNERRLYRYITLVVLPEMEEHQLALEEKQKKELKEMLRREQAAAAAIAAESRPKRSTRLAALADEDDKKNDSSSMDGDTDSRWGVRATRTRRAAVRGARWQEEQEEQLAALEASEGDEDGEEQGQAGEGARPTRGRNKSDQDEYQDEDSDDAQPPSTPNTVEINTRGRPRRAAAVKADLMRPVKPTRRRRARSDSEDGAESDEPFFLNCDVCKKSGWNEDDGQHLISCKECSIWQHMMCHDRADRLEGKPKRNWSEEQFLCASCTAKAQNKRPRRGKKPKEAVATDGEDVIMDAPNPAEVNDTPMEVSQTADAILEHDPMQPSTEHVAPEQHVPPFSDTTPAQSSSILEPNGPQQYSETLAQAQRALGPAPLEPPEQQMTPNAPAPKQYSEELALAQKVVASGALDNPLATHPNGLPPSSGYTVPLNSTSTNGFSYSIPPS